MAEGRLEVPEVGPGPRAAGQGRRAGGARRRDRRRARRRDRQRQVHAVQRAVRRRGQHARASAGRRPGVAHATVVGRRDGADRLLDWLEVPRRHRHDPEPALDGLVLLDLPDHDSVRLEHRLEVDRLVGLVDVLVWVLDPEKYADAAVHDRYLVPLASHAGVLLVVLNQVDRLDAGGGAGLPGRPAGAAGPRGAGRDAAAGGLGPHRRRASPSCAASWPGGWPPGGRPPTGSPPTSAAPRPSSAAHCPARRAARRAGGTAPTWRRTSGDALAAAAGVPDGRRRGRALDGARRRRAHRLAAACAGRASCGPIRSARLHLGDERARTSLPPAGPVELAGGGDGGPAGPGRRGRRACPRRGGTTCAAPSRTPRRALADRLDRAVAGTDLGPDRVPLWQRAVGGLQWAAGAGRPGRRALAAGARRRSGSSSSTTSSRCPGCRASRCRRCCSAGGLLAGLLLAPGRRPLVAAAGAPAAAGRPSAGCGPPSTAVAEDELLGPMAAVREDADRFRAAVEAAGR